MENLMFHVSRSTFGIALSLLFCGLAFLSTSAFAQSQSSVDKTQAQDSVQSKTDWTQWRGPNRDGMISGDNWPNDVSEQALKQKWRVEMGPSYSGPIVANGKVFVTETKDKKFEVVHALNPASGKEIWKTDWEGSMKVPMFARSNGDWIRSTPTYDDGMLYVAGMVDFLVCIDAETGKKIWGFNFPEKLGTPKPDFGFVCSPLVDGDYVYVQAGASFCKLEKKSGKLVWRTLKDNGGMFGSAFSSPIVAEICGKRQLVVQTRSDLAGVSIEDGEVLWKQPVPNFRGMNILTPCVIGDSIFTSSYSRNSFLYNLEESGSKINSKIGWQNGVRGYMSSPVIINGHAYLHLQNRCISCIDLETGKEKWKSPRFGQYSSMIAQGDKILALDQKGKLLLIKANPEKFELISERKVSNQETWAHLAISGNQIFIRELKAISMFEWDLKD